MQNVDASALLAIFQNGFTTVEVQFCNDRLADGNEQPAGKHYTYKVPLVWNVQVGDWLIVLPGSAYKTVAVRKVHTQPMELGNDGRFVKWAVQKIDGTFYFNIKEREEALQNTIAALKRKREAELLLEELNRTIGADNITQIMQGFGALLGVQPIMQAPQVQQVQQQPAAQPQVAAQEPNPVAAQRAAGDAAYTAHLATQQGQPVGQVQQAFGQPTPTVDVAAMAQAQQQRTDDAAAAGQTTMQKPSWAQ
jgi:hypothetical protein